MIWAIVAIGLFVSFVYAPRITTAIAASFVAMFLYVWIYDPQCQNYKQHHPEWGGTCGTQFR